MTKSIFGSLYSFDDVNGTVSFLLVIVTVIILEKTLEKLDQRTEFTRWETTFKAIKDELVAVGFMAFVLMCVINSFEIDYEWLYPVKLADMVIPTTVFAIIFQDVIFAMINSWEEIHIRNALSKIDDTNAATEATVYSKRTELELKAANYVFCDQFRFRVFSFNYSEYVGRVTCKYIIDLIRVSVWDWATVLVCILINWFRHSVKIYDGHTLCKNAQGKERCINMNDIKLFTGFGFILLMSFLVTACISYYYIQSLINSLLDNPYKPVDSFTDSLFDIESGDAVDTQPSQEAVTLSAKTLDEAVNCRFDIHREAFHAADSPSYLSELIGLQYFLSQESKKKGNASLKNQRRTSDVIEHGFSHDDKKNILDTVTEWFKEWILPEEEEERGVYSTKLIGYFFASTPEIYYSSIRRLFMILSFYISLWIINFSYSCNKFHQPDLSGWKCLSILPALLSMVVMAYIVRTSGQIKAIVYRDDDILMDMLQEKQELYSQRDYIKSTILKDEALIEKNRAPLVKLSSAEIIKSISYRLVSIDRIEGEPAIKKLFDNIWSGHNGRISKRMIREYFEENGMVFTKKIWIAFLKALDKNEDGFIEIRELNDFLFENNI